MQIKTENGYVSSYAWVGNIVGGIEVPDPPDREHFEAHFTAYRVKDGVLEYDVKQNTELERKALCDELRKRRETECFSYINRGWLWYNRLTATQRGELTAWYEDWLDVTETLTVPAKPSWL